MKLIAKMVGATFLFDLILYLFLYPLVLLPNVDNYSVNLAILCIRVIGCSAIGFLFARRIRNQPINEKRCEWIALVAGLFGIYYLLPTKCYIFVSNLVWWGAHDTFNQLDIHPIRSFLGVNFDQGPVFSYMCLIVVFQLSRLRLAKKASSL